MNWILTELETFLQNKGRSIVVSTIAMVITFIIGKLSLSRFAAPDEILSWSNALGAAAILALTHFIDHHLGNANVDVTGPVGAPPSQPAQPVAPAPAAGQAAQPGSSAK